MANLRLSMAIGGSLRLWRPEYGHRRPFSNYRAAAVSGLSLDLVEKKGLDRFKARVYFACGQAYTLGAAYSSERSIAPPWAGDRTANR
jgi:hypothetical protein